MTMRRPEPHCFIFYFVFCSVLVSVVLGCSGHHESSIGWEVYGGDKRATHFSALTQIDTSNITGLKVAWIYRTGDADNFSQMQVNPLIYHNTLFGVSPRLKLFSIDASSGLENWVFDPMDTSEQKSGYEFFSLNVCRGMALYHDSIGGDRIFYTANSYLYCIDAESGVPVESFGVHGKIDLHENLRREVSKMFVTATSPGIVYKNLIIIGTRVSEDAVAAPGDIRAYDVRSGRLVWVFHTIPMPGEEGFETWKDKEAHNHIGGANCWAGFSMDEQAGIVYAPIGSASADFYGGKRLGDDLFANCVVALDAATGKRIWHFQTVHHDVWDRDLPTAPIVTTVLKDGKKRDVVVQISKSGFIFVLDRKTGVPLYPVEERPVPVVSELKGEELSPTQPFPTFYPSFCRQSIDVINKERASPDSIRQKLIARLSGYKYGNLFDPPSKEGTIVFPGLDGGAEWGGGAFDPEFNILYVNANEMPWIVKMASTEDEKKLALPQSNLEAGKTLYTINCMNCHGADLDGNSVFPSLVNLGTRFSEGDFLKIVSTGRRMMPSFRHFSEGEKDALASFLLNDQNRQKRIFSTNRDYNDPYTYLPYTARGIFKFPILSNWGTFTAIDLNTGRIVWKDTLGESVNNKKQIAHTGNENYGGSVVTAGGLVFIAAASDGKFRAFNKRTGKLLWEYKLPAPGFATPATYMIDGVQYVVLACGGGKLGTPSGDYYVAFKLGD